MVCLISSLSIKGKDSFRGDIKIILPPFWKRLHSKDKNLPQGPVLFTDGSNVF